MGQPDLASMEMGRAVTFVHQHTLMKLPDEQARKDWEEEIELSVDYPVEVLDDLVRTGAAVSHQDAYDILRTETLCHMQPHREARLRASLTERRAPRMRDHNARNAVADGS